MVSRSDAPGSIIGLERKTPYPLQSPASCCHRLKIGTYNLFHFADSCIRHQLRRACPRASQIFSGRFKGHIESHSFLPSETVNHCFWGVINPDILVHDAMHFHSLAEQISAKEENLDRRIFDLWFSCLPFHGQPDIMWGLSRKLMKGKRRNKTNDAAWNLFGDLCKSNLSGDIHIGELMKSPGNRDKRSLITKSIKGPSMDSMGKGFICPNEPPSLPNISYGLFFGWFHG
jgi:hypothetical protein